MISTTRKNRRREKRVQTSSCDEKKKSVSFVKYKRRKITNAKELDKLAETCNHWYTIQASSNVACDFELFQEFWINAAAAAAAVNEATAEDKRTI